jgi:hypothetical protein
MKIEDIVLAMQTISIHATIQPTGSPDWTRVFLVYGGVTLGRVNYHKGKLYGLKIYESPCRDLSLYEYQYASINVMLFAGYILPSEHFHSMLFQAIRMHKDDKAYKVKRRAMLPRSNTSGKPISRKKVEGQSPRYCFYKLLKEYIDNLNKAKENDRA